MAVALWSCTSVSDSSLAAGLNVFCATMTVRMCFVLGMCLVLEKCLVLGQVLCVLQKKDSRNWVVILCCVCR